MAKGRELVTLIIIVILVMFLIIGKIVYDIVSEHKRAHRVKVVASGHFDPIHPGHIRHLRKAKRLGTYLVVVVSSDDAALIKKGYVFQPAKDRAEIVSALRFVDEVVINSKDKDGLTAEILRDIEPNIFAKGGDRNPFNMPLKEVAICKEIGCQVVYGVGEQYTSSTLLLQRLKEYKGRLRWKPTK